LISSDIALSSSEWAWRKGKRPATTVIDLIQERLDTMFAIGTSWTPVAECIGEDPIPRPWSGKPVASDIAVGRVSSATTTVGVAAAV
jgi:hypothetical protein